MILTKHPITKPQTDTIHILGNGASIELFNRSDWPENHEFVGCNFSNPDLRPDYTIMMDARPIMQFYGGYKLTIPLVISDRCQKFIEKDKGGWHKLHDDAFILVDIIKLLHDKQYKYPMNSGHHATLYALNRNDGKVKKVHLWGFDSFWSDDISSKTDSVINRNRAPRIKSPVADTWRTYWAKIMQDHQAIDFEVHQKA